MFDVCVIGAGPGGYVAAIRAAQMGLKVAVVEKGSLGGVCLNVGCIPSKALISAAHFYHRMQTQAGDMGFTLKDVSLDMKKLKTWKDSVCGKMSLGVSQLLKGNKIEVFKGEAFFLSPEEIQIKGSDKKSLKANNFILAVGSRPVAIPGFEVDEKMILSSTGVLDLEKLPRKVVVLGGGYIGLEVSSYLSQLGVDVEVVEASDSILKGVSDPDCAKVVQRQLKKQKVKLHLKTKALSCKKTSKSVEVEVENEQGKVQNLKCDKLIVTVGRKPNSDSINVKDIGLHVDSQGFVTTDSQRRTNCPHIFAIGDVSCQPMLAHKASYEGVMVAEILGGQNRVFDPKVIPSVIFTHPEIASAGLSEKEAREKYPDLKVGQFSFGANGRAVSLMEAHGFVKTLAEPEHNVVVGVHMVGPEVSQLISEAVLAIEMGAVLEDLALSIHPHPTLSEAVMEAAEVALGHPLHALKVSK